MYMFKMVEKVVFPFNVDIYDLRLRLMLLIFICTVTHIETFVEHLLYTRHHRRC